MKEDKEFELLKLAFEKSFELRNLELANFWKRGWFFGALLLAIAAGYFQLFNSINNKSYCVFVSFLGLLVSLLQSLMNRGSKYWQERWNHITRNKESALNVYVTNAQYQDETYLLDLCTLVKDENALTISRRYSVTKLTILVWDIVGIFWLALWLKDLNILVNLTNNTVNVIYVYHGVVILYVLLFFFLSGKPLEKRGKWFPRFKKGGGKVYFNFSKKKEIGREDNNHHQLLCKYYFENDRQKLEEAGFEKNS